MKKRSLALFLAFSVYASAVPVTIYAEGPDAVTTSQEGSDEESIALKQVQIGSSTYAVVNLEDISNKENQIYSYTVTGRGGTTVTNYVFTDLKQLEDTGYYYIVVNGMDLIDETLYAYTGNVEKSQTYTELYKSLGLDAKAEDFDTISSATAFTGYHAKDISGTVVYGTDDNGNKIITGIATGRETEAVNGTDYVTTKILAADEKELTEEQTALTQKVLKKNPTSDGSGIKSVALKDVTYGSSRYGIGEFAITPDDTVEGYVWSEYWDNVYGATVSDGSNSTGAVHWIDLYGEEAVSGPHYNKIELALNSGTSTASNAATVNRYDAFIEDGMLKSGLYTITIYADGYEDLTASVFVKGESSIALADKTVVYSGNAVDMEAEVSGSSSAIIYNYYADEACTEALEVIPVNAGTYYVVASVEADDQYNGATSNVAKLVINKAKSTITLKSRTVTYNGKSKKIGTAIVTGSTGKVTYSYYSDKDCTKALEKAPVNAGTYYVKAKVASSKNYKSASSKAVKLVINKKAASIRVDKKSASYKVSSLKKAAKSFSMGTSVTSGGKLTYEKVSGSSKLKVNKNGKVTTARNTKKGTYKMKVKISSKATKNYKAAVKTITINVVVK